ncbi:hypothetical protein KAH55_03585, partial [bacterium]|nr:hypothetical protein [bacterium]
MANYMLAVVTARNGQALMPVDFVIEYGLRAWDDDEKELTTTQKISLAHILTQAYQQQGDFDAAEKWKLRRLDIGQL